jgi:hypothetical protein
MDIKNEAIGFKEKVSELKDKLDYTNDSLMVLLEGCMLNEDKLNKLTSKQVLNNVI